MTALHQSARDRASDGARGTENENAPRMGRSLDHGQCGAKVSLVGCCRLAAVGAHYKTHARRLSNTVRFGCFLTGTCLSAFGHSGRPEVCLWLDAFILAVGDVGFMVAPSWNGTVRGHAIAMRQ